MGGATVAADFVSLGAMTDIADRLPSVAGDRLSRRPLLLLDVDGVLNPFAAKPGHIPPGFSEHTLLGYRVLLTPRHGEWLARLGDRFELVWATTWEHEANTLIAPRVGLPTDLAVITFGELDQNAGWKLPAVEHFCGDRPAAWIDDDLGREAENWARSRAAPTLLLRADPGVGLARRHIKALERFSDRLAGADEIATGPEGS
jgi:hypothetical protein